MLFILCLKDQRINLQNAFLFLTEDKVIDFVDYQGACTLIEIIDRGSLKWPSTPVLHIMFKLWKTDRGSYKI